MENIVSAGKSKLTIYDRATKEARDYWVARLSNERGISDIAPDLDGPYLYSAEKDFVEVKPPNPLTGELRRLTGHSPFLLYTTLLTALKICLHRYTGDRRIVVGSPARRPQDGPAEYCNALAILEDVDDELTVRELLQRVRQTLLDAYKRQSYSYQRALADLGLDETNRRCPLFAIALELKNIHMPLPDVHNEITMTFCDERDEISGGVAFDRKRYTGERIRSFAGHYLRVLSELVEKTGARISELEMLAEEERRKILIEWNDTRAEYPRETPIHRLFEEQVERAPQAVALIFEDRRLTYAELNKRANQLAHFLRSLGVGPEVPVGVFMERSPEMIVALLGVLKAGGAYAPLDPACPRSRLAFTIEDIKIALILTEERLLPALPDMPAGKVVCAGSDWEAIAQMSEENPSGWVSADNLAYVMYTSGSTGVPKGAGVIHRSVVRLVKAVSYAELDENQVFLQFAPVTFDASTFEIWGALLNGARLVVMPPLRLSLEELGRAIERYQVTTLWLTSGLFSRMVEVDLAGLKPVKQLLAGGDVLSAPHVRTALRELKGCALINGYGPTENTTFTCSYQMTSPDQVGDKIPIGKPISNTRVYLLDGSLNPVPSGSVGEVWVGGDGLARGYLNRPDLTAEKFMPDPFGGQTGARLYRTGDLARYLTDGNIEFLGRRDNQVKIRGFRVELGEIEAELRRQAGVGEAVVVAREERGGDKRLVAYIAPQGGDAPSVARLREELKLKLPEYMIPASWVVLESMPLTPNGKVDRKALPAPDRASHAGTAAFVAPRAPVEEQVAKIWAEVLDLSQVGVYDNYFELGGHSLLAVRLISRLRDTLQVEVPIRWLFESPTVAELSQLIIAHEAKPGQTEKIAKALKRMESLSAEEISQMLRERKAAARAEGAAAGAPVLSPSINATRSLRP